MCEGRRRLFADGTTSSSAAGKHRFIVKTFNEISPVGLRELPSDTYRIVKDEQELEADAHADAHAILLRSHKLSEAQVSESVRVIARCGAGTNNIPVERLTELGVPVLNTPGANANAVKELVLCALLLASRGIVQGAVRMKELGDAGEAHAQVEKVKKQFGGHEIVGKTLGVIGLGNIGAAVAESALLLGMNVVGYDPVLTVEQAWRLPSNNPKMRRAETVSGVLSEADYVSLHVPFIKGVTENLIDGAATQHMKDSCHLLNFSRGELVDSSAMLARFNGGASGRYVSDFPDDVLYAHPNTIILPHLGASTEEAEENSAAMAARTVRNFLETGSIVNSVNFPTLQMEARPDSTARICITTENVPGMLGQILSLLGGAGINVLQQANASQGLVAYNVIDIARGIDKYSTAQGTAADADSLAFTSWSQLQDAITEIEGVLNTRVILGEQASAGYYKHGEAWRRALGKTD